MKITQRFALGVGQHEVDFVDIDTSTDTPLFLDPFFIGTRTDAWSKAASQTIRNFFQTFLSLIREGQPQRARALFDHLHEPNETCLGLSQWNPNGRAIGKIDADKLFDSILHSAAINTGVVEDLEDFRLFIPGIDKDKVSDITTNVIRKHLIDYTKDQCKLWGIAMKANSPTGFYWSSPNRRWVNEYDSALVIDDRRILLTPKGVVSFVKKYTPQKYHAGFILEYLQHEHLAMGSALVQHRKDGTPYVTKDLLRERVAPYSKEYISTFTQNHPAVFADFKRWVKANSSSIGNGELSEDDPQLVADFLVERLGEIPLGPEAATRYHRLCVSALELLMYPNLISPAVEKEINEGRKRIDILFDNAARTGFFHRVHTVSHVPAQYIFVECKNYSRDIANPEVDQMIARFSVNHGCVGLLLFRQAEDMDRLLARCSDAWLANHHVVIPIRDIDIIDLLSGSILLAAQRVERFLSDSFRRISTRA